MKTYVQVTSSLYVTYLRQSVSQSTLNKVRNKIDFYVSIRLVYGFQHTSVFSKVPKVQTFEKKVSTEQIMENF